MGLGPPLGFRFFLCGTVTWDSCVSSLSVQPRSHTTPAFPAQEEGMAGRGARVSYPRKWRKKVQAPNFPVGNGDSFALREPHVSIQPWTPPRAGARSWPAGLRRQPDWRRSETLHRRAGQAETRGLPLLRQEVMGLESGFCLDGDGIAVFKSYVRPPGPATVRARLSAWLEDEGRRPRRLKAQALSPPLRGQFCGHGTGGPPAHLPEQRK